MPIDHIGLTVPAGRFNDCVAFYLSALAPLGYEKRFQVSETVIGLGSTQDYVPGRADFWIIGIPEVQGQVAHVAFSAQGNTPHPPTSKYKSRANGCRSTYD